jgi:hypothetical protein
MNKGPWVAAVSWSLDAGWGWAAMGELGDRRGRRGGVGKRLSLPAAIGEEIALVNVKLTT